MINFMKKIFGSKASGEYKPNFTTRYRNWDEARRVLTLRSNSDISVDLNSDNQQLYHLSHLYELLNTKMADQKEELDDLRQLCIELTRTVDKTIPELNRMQSDVQSDVAELTERVENALSASYTAYDPITSQITELQKAHVALNNTVVDHINNEIIECHLPQHFEEDHWS